MHKTGELVPGIARHTLNLTATLGAVGLVVLLLVLAASMQPVSQALGDTTKIPDGYATIQAAIEAAGDGDTILVVEGRYQGNLSVTEGITLSGSWDPT